MNLVETLDLRTGRIVLNILRLAVLLFFGNFSVRRFDHHVLVRIQVGRRKARDLAGRKLRALDGRQLGLLSLPDPLRSLLRHLNGRLLCLASATALIAAGILSLPQGFDTVLSESTTISAGQKQLFTIARAMLQGNPMIILDEATSSVDTRTEQIIQDTMERLTVGRACFIIAHRLSTIKNADLILVMNEGDVIEKGTHKELLAQGGFYAKLYNAQFEQAEATS